MAFYGENAKMKKSDLTISTFVQYVEDFIFWFNAGWRAHRLPEKEIAKMLVTGLKPDLLREEIYLRSCETLQEVMDESRAELSTYRDILEITDRVKMADVKKEKRDPPYSHGVARKTADTKASGGTDPYISKNQETWSMQSI